MALLTHPLYGMRERTLSLTYPRKGLLDFSLLFGGPATSIKEARSFASPPHDEFAFLAELLLERKSLRLLLLDHCIIYRLGRALQKKLLTNTTY